MNIFITSENQEETWLVANFRKEPCMYMGKEIKGYSYSIISGKKRLKSADLSGLNP